MRIGLSFLAAGAFALATCGAAGAATLFDTGITPATVLNGRASDVDSANESAQLFTLSDAAIVTSVAWSGLYSPGNTPGTDAFTLSLYADASGLPAESSFLSVGLTASRTATAHDIFGLTIHTYGAATSLSLAAGSYWLSIVNDTTADTDDDWFWSYENFGVTAAGRVSVFSGAWSSRAETFDLTLEGELAAIPLPAALGSMGLGLAALVLLRRRRAV